MVIMERYSKNVVYNFEFTDLNDSTNESNKLRKLGMAMFNFYQGKELTLEQIDLISNSTPAQQVNGMNIVARDLLFYGNKRSSYLSYDKNCNILMDAKKKKRKK